MFISVDLPDPDGPTMTTNSPSSTAQVDAVERPHRRRARVVLGDAGELEHAASGRQAGGPSLSSITPSPPGRRRRCRRSPATMPSANTPSSTPTRWVAPPPSATSSGVAALGQREHRLDGHGQHALGGDGRDHDVDRQAVGDRRAAGHGDVDRDRRRAVLGGLGRPDRGDRAVEALAARAARPDGGALGHEVGVGRRRRRGARSGSASVSSICGVGGVLAERRRRRCRCAPRRRSTRSRRARSCRRRPGRGPPGTPRRRSSSPPSSPRRR